MASKGFFFPKYLVCRQCHEEVNRYEYENYEYLQNLTDKRETLQCISLLPSLISCVTTSDEAEEFYIISVSLEATSEFRRTEHLLLMAPEQSWKPSLRLDTLVLAELLEDAFPI